MEGGLVVVHVVIEDDWEVSKSILNQLYPIPIVDVWCVDQGRSCLQVVLQVFEVFFSIEEAP